MLGLAGMAGADDLAKKIEGELNAGLPATNTLDCSGAIPIACGDLVSGDNTGGVSTADVYSCISWDESGPDVVYEFTLATDQIVTVTISNMTADLDVFLLSACDEASCLEYGNTTFTTDCLTAGTYYIVVDGYGGAESAYDLEVACVDCPQTPDNDTCEDAIDLCGLADGTGAFNAAYTTVGANNDYDPGGFGNVCTGYSAAGGDVVYSVCLGTGGTLDLTQTGTHDMSLYLITDCSDPTGSCVVGSDNCCSGADEIISYTNTGGPTTFYVIVDGYSDEGAGTVYGTVTGCCATATEENSWGQMKELFR